MLFPSFNQKLGSKVGSNLAIAIALAAGTVLATAGFAEPAFAQKKKDKKEEEARPQYSKEFVAAYQPIEQGLNAPAPDFAALKAMIPSITGLAQSQDEKMAAGNVVYNIGAKSNDQALQLQGMKLMIASGKVAPAQAGQYNFIAYQLSTIAEQHAEARTYLQAAMDANYSTANVSSDQLRVNMAESFFAENRFAEGLDYLGRGIAQRKAGGLAVDEQWYRRGLTVAYNNEVVPQVYDYVAMWIVDYPSATNWRDAINIARNLNTFDVGEILDLLRLSYKVGAMTEKVEFIEYIESADARRLPKEVETVIQHGYAKGRISKDDIFVADSLRVATGRLAADRADLPALERDARAANVGLRTVVAAGDTFLNYGEMAKAEEFYAKSLGIPGVDTQLVLTRLGITQVHQGKYEEAMATFAKVQGKRQPIAKLWSAYAKGEAAKAAPAAAPVVMAPAPS
ncbi:MAG: hypothetical protein APF82_03450 [Sphingomonadales bacterium BRH_c42]|nr:MAG: hypothetical protein APF82_03450 [Sphingomonadales bacterium BRH_c42]